MGPCLPWHAVVCWVVPWKVESVVGPIGLTVVAVMVVLALRKGCGMLSQCSVMVVVVALVLSSRSQSCP